MSDNQVKGCPYPLCSLCPLFAISLVCIYNLFLAKPIILLRSLPPFDSTKIALANTTQDPHDLFPTVPGTYVFPGCIIG
ncbi:unnamed protein product [Gulo gulo]|uniref:Uncharacterized protein n=1 Tax=Gulo gulo TaxID=48420 RepID=A0A9X9M4S1_GULGU|nr:unnamed protein product [Gulo gulo]